MSTKLNENDWVGWAQFCRDTIERCEDLPDRAAEFHESVTERLSGIAETIERRQSVTEGQRSAISNMADGVERWLDR
jgi:hypothetical protein